MIDVDIPRVNTTDLEEITKKESLILFTQMKLANKDYIRFASSETYHKKMVVDFFKEIGQFIPHPYTTENLANNPCPIIKLGDYELIGMGSALVNVDRKELVYQQPSQDFKLSLNRPAARALQEYMNGWFIH